MEYKLIINENPIPASRPRVSRWSTYYNEPYKSHKELLKSLVTESIPKQEKPLFDTSMALKMTVTFYMQIPASLSKKKQLLLDGSYHMRKPDNDNLLKSVLDAMNKVIYNDDGQIAIIHTNKIYSFEPRTEIVIKEIR